MDAAMVVAFFAIATMSWLCGLAMGLFLMVSTTDFKVKDRYKIMLGIAHLAVDQPPRGEHQQQDSSESGTQGHGDDVREGEHMPRAPRALFEPIFITQDGVKFHTCGSCSHLKHSRFFA